MKLPAGIELNCKDPFVYTSPTIDRQIHLCLHTPMDLIPSPFHQISCDRRMVGNLFEVDGAAIDPALICFS